MPNCGGRTDIEFEIALRVREPREVDSERVEQLGACALHEGEVLRMEHHAARIGILVVDPNRDLQPLSVP